MFKYISYPSLKAFFLYLLYTFIVIALYIELSHFWVNIGGFSGISELLDLPMLFLLLIIFYIPKKNVFHSVLISIAALLPLYLLFDLFYYYLKRNPVLSDFQNIQALSDFSPYFLVLGFSLLTLGYAPFFYAQYKVLFKQNERPLLLVKLFIIVVVISAFNSKNFFHHFNQHFNYTNFSLESTIKDNGRMASFIYFSHKEYLARQELSTYRNADININQELFGDISIKEKRDIYIVVLESFIDPRLLKNITFNRSPLYEGMNKYLHNGNFSHTVSPIYGGGTSQAEFEILTGVHAFGALNTSEFNVLHGKKTSGFVDELTAAGYDNIAFIATKSIYYNSAVAYRSLGLNNIHFLEEVSDFSLNPQDDRIFDGDLYDYALKKRAQLQKPFLLYALGMYGHIPFKRNKTLRPDIITTNINDPIINNIANQFYYRTKALSHYIDQILQTDKNAIILVSSDHLPPILNQGVHYSKERHVNISLLLVDGKPVDLDQKKYYEFSKVILQTLTDQPLAQSSQHTMKALYMKLLSESY